MSSPVLTVLCHHINIILFITRSFTGTVLLLMYDSIALKRRRKNNRLSVINKASLETMLLVTCGALSLASIVVIAGQQVFGPTIVETRHLRAGDTATSDEISVSLWLMPPIPASHELAKQISTLSQNGAVAPLFAPHITVVGGVKCRSEEHVREIAKALEEGLAAFGKVPCTVSPNAHAGKGVWNQALFLVVEPSAEFLHLCEKARAILGLETKNWKFPEPASYPHISMFYGVDDVPDIAEVQSVPPFLAHRLALWRTDPPSKEGVPQWKEVSAFDINL